MGAYQFFSRSASGLGCCRAIKTRDELTGTEVDLSVINPHKTVLWACNFAWYWVRCWFSMTVCFCSWILTHKHQVVGKFWACKALKIGSARRQIKKQGIHDCKTVRRQKISEEGIQDERQNQWKIDKLKFPIRIRNTLLQIVEFSLASLIHFKSQ